MVIFEDCFNVIEVCTSLCSSLSLWPLAIETRKSISMSNTKHFFSQWHPLKTCFLFDRGIIGVFDFQNNTRWNDVGLCSNLFFHDNAEDTPLNQSENLISSGIIENLLKLIKKGYILCPVDLVCVISFIKCAIFWLK